MKINVLLNKEAVYDKRNLVRSESGKRWYPSKKMFAEFLKKYKDIRGSAEIWSHAKENEVEINVVLTYKPCMKPKKISDELIPRTKPKRRLR